MNCPACATACAVWHSSRTVTHYYCPACRPGYAGPPTVTFTLLALATVVLDLGISEISSLNKPELRDAIRQAVGLDTRPQEGFDWIELRGIVLEAGVDVDPSGYRIDELEAQSEPETADEPSEPEEDPMPWTDYRGGSA